MPVKKKRLKVFDINNKTDAHVISLQVVELLEKTHLDTYEILGILEIVKASLLMGALDEELIN